jgi:adenylosuccinate synthase
LVIRYGGGNNAGHTVVNEHGAFKLHVVPSGIFDPSTVNVIGTGVVIDPAELIKELEDLQSQGISTTKLFISERAHVIMPYHLLQDQYEETLRGDHKIGTTGRGVGPAYADKMSRTGIQLGEPASLPWRGGMSRWAWRGSPANRGSLHPGKLSCIRPSRSPQAAFA